MLDRDFFDRDALLVAPDLLGCELEHAGVRVRITEVEAYRSGGDTACHAWRGKTARNAPMFGPPGHAYVYRCYGIHLMLNFVTEGEGVASAVLLRAAEPVDGVELMRSRRGVDGPAMLAGPGRVAQALGVRLDQSGARLGDELRLHGRVQSPPLLVGPRVGVDYALPEHRDAPWRFAVAGSRWVSVKRGLSTPGAAS